jgi:Glycosyltransferase family 87
MTHSNLTKPAINNRWNYLLVFLAAGIILFEAGGNIYDLFIKARPHDFHKSYLAVRALISGTNLYESGTGGYIYPPFYAFILTPLGGFSEKIIHLTWLAVNLALFPIILTLGFRVLASGFQLNVSRWQAAGACALAVLLSQDQIHWELLENQNDLLILAGFAVALYWLDKKPFMAGVGLGLTAAIKYQSLFFLPFLLPGKRWRMVVGLMTGVALGAFLPALMIGWDRNLEYWAIALRGIANITSLTQLPVDYAAKVPLVTWERNVSIGSSIIRVFLEHGWPKNIAYLLVAAIAVFTLFLLRRMFQKDGIAFIWRTPGIFRNPQQEKMIVTLEWAALMICMLAFAPQGMKRHLILLLNVNLLTAVMILFPRPGVPRWPLVVGTLIIQLVFLCRFPWRAFSHVGKYIGLPYWGYLLFLPILIGAGLAYYRALYHNAPSPEKADPQQDLVIANEVRHTAA